MFKKIVNLFVVLAVAGIFSSCSLEEPASANSVQEPISTQGSDAQLLNKPADAPVGLISERVLFMDPL